MNEPTVIFEPPAPAGGPHSDIRRESLIEAGSPVYVLVGGILRAAGADDDEPFDILVATGITREFDAFFRPMMQFLRCVHTEEQTAEWLAWAGAPSDALNDLVRTGLVARIDTTSPLTAAESFKGIRIIPHSIPGSAAPDHPTQISVLRDVDSPITTYAPVELAKTLWGLDRPLDLPSAIRLLSRQTGLPRDRMARRVLTNIPDLLSLGLARLEWVKAPGL